MRVNPQDELELSVAEPRLVSGERKPHRRRAEIELASKGGVRVQRILMPKRDKQRTVSVRVRPGRLARSLREPVQPAVRSAERGCHAGVGVRTDTRVGLKAIRAIRMLGHEIIVRMPDKAA